MAKRTVHVVASLDGGGGYEWKIVDLGRDDEGNFWVRSGEGCSCYDITDEEWVPVFAPSDLDAAIDQWYNLDDDAKSAFSRGNFRLKVRELMGQRSAPTA